MQKEIWQKRLSEILNDTTGFFLQQHFNKKLTRYNMGSDNTLFKDKIENLISSYVYERKLNRCVKFPFIFQNIKGN